MTPVFAARRAEEFHRLVEGDRAAGASATRLADPLAVVDLLRAVPDPEPRAEFTADLRVRLLAAADILLVPSETTSRLTIQPRRTARDRRIAAAVGGLAVIGATSSLAVAAQSALPGDMLYPLKRAMESAETQVHASDTARGESLLGYASDRLAEARALSEAGGSGDGAYVEQALVDFADQATLASDLVLADYEETGDEQGVQDLRDFTADSMDALASLESVLPPEAHDELQYAAQVLEEIDRAAARVCPTCAGGISQIPAVLLSSGPVAAPSVVVVPETKLRTADPRPGTGPRSGGGKGSTGATGGSGPGDAPGGTALPEVGSITDPGSAGSGSGGGSDPVGQLTDSLTGKGGGTPASNGGKKLPGVPDTDDVVTGVDDTVGDVVDDVTGTVGGVTGGLGGATGGLTQP